MPNLLSDKKIDVSVENFMSLYDGEIPFETRTFFAFMLLINHPITFQELYDIYYDETIQNLIDLIDSLEVYGLPHCVTNIPKRNI